MYHVDPHPSLVSDHSRFLEMHCTRYPVRKPYSRLRWRFGAAAASAGRRANSESAAIVAADRDRNAVGARTSRERRFACGQCRKGLRPRTRVYWREVRAARHLWPRSRTGGRGFAVYVDLGCREGFLLAFRSPGRRDPFRNSRRLRAHPKCLRHQRQTHDGRYIQPRRNCHRFAVAGGACKRDLLDPDQSIADFI
jgi:hypothetical protein